MKHYLFKNKKGIAIPVVIGLLVVTLIGGTAMINNMMQKKNQIYLSLDSNKGECLTTIALEKTFLKIRREMNVNNGLGAVILKFISILKKGPDDWFLLLRIPALKIETGTTAGVGVKGYHATMNLSVPIRKVYRAKDLGLDEYLEDIGGKADIKVIAQMKDVVPVGKTQQLIPAINAKGKGINSFNTSINATLSFGSQKLTDFSFGKSGGLGSKLVGLIESKTTLFDKIPAEIGFDPCALLSGIKIKVYGVPIISVDKLIPNSIRDMVTLKINLRGIVKGLIAMLIDKVLEALPGFEGLTFEVSMEKAGVIEVAVNTKYIPSGGIRREISKSLIASKEIKVVDIQPIAPLHTFFWINSKNGKLPENTGGHLYMDNFPWQLLINIMDTIKNIKHPGMCNIGGKTKQVVAFSWLECLIMLGKSGRNILPSIYSPPGADNFYWPYSTFSPNGGFAFVWYTGIPVLPIDPVSIVVMIAKIFMGQGFNIHLFGRFSISPPLLWKVDGNVYKMFQFIVNGATPQIAWFPPIVVWAYIAQEKAYCYLFLKEKAPKESKDKLDNLYPLDNYKRKATYVYKTSQEMFNDPKVKKEDGTYFLDGCYFVEGDLIVKGNFKGKGVLATGKNIIIKDNIKLVHEDKHKNRSVMSLVAPKGKVIFSKGGGSNVASGITTQFKGFIPDEKKSTVVEPPIYAKGGLQMKGGELLLKGNLVVDQLSGGDLKGGCCTIQYNSDNTTASFLALIPVIGKYMPDRYWAVMSQQYASWELGKYIEDIDSWLEPPKFFSIDIKETAAKKWDDINFEEVFQQAAGSFTKEWNELKALKDVDWSQVATEIGQNAISQGVEGLTQAGTAAASDYMSGAQGGLSTSGGLSGSLSGGMNNLNANGQSNSGISFDSSAASNAFTWDTTPSEKSNEPVTAGDIFGWSNKDSEESSAPADTQQEESKPDPGVAEAQRYQDLISNMSSQSHIDEVNALDGASEKEQQEYLDKWKEDNGIKQGGGDIMGGAMEAIMGQGQQQGQ